MNGKTHRVMKPQAWRHTTGSNHPATCSGCVRVATGETLARPGGPRITLWTIPGLAGWALVITFTAAIAGCVAAPRIETQKAPGADYSEYRTFAVMPASASDLTQPPRQMIAARLTAMGLTEVDEAQADLAVSLKAEAVPKQDVTYWGCLPEPVSRARLGWYAGGAAPRGETIRWYLQQTLSVAIVDRRTRSLAWSGRFTAEGPPEIASEQLQKGIEELFEQFPAGPRVASLAPRQ